MRRMKFLLFVAAMTLATSNPVWSFNGNVPAADVVGSARFTYLMWNVFDATLYAPQGRLQNGQPFALSLKYLRNFSSRDLAKSSIEEMRKQGLRDEVKLARWYSQLERIFPNVSPGNVITGAHQAGYGTFFYYNNQPIGQIQDPEFGRYFFNIWLGERASDQRFRQALLGR